MIHLLFKAFSFITHLSSFIAIDKSLFFTTAFKEHTYRVSMDMDMDFQYKNDHKHNGAKVSTTGVDGEWVRMTFQKDTDSVLTGTNNRKY